MKSTFFIFILGFLYSLSLNAQQEREHFYYYLGAKIFLEQRTDQIFLKFSQDAEEEQLRSLISRDASLRLKSTQMTQMEQIYADNKSILSLIISKIEICVNPSNLCHLCAKSLLRQKKYYI